MHWATIAVTGSDLEGPLDTALDRLRADLPEGRADVVFAFLSTEHAGAADAVLASTRRALGEPHVLGCGAQGVIGGGREYEHVPAVSILAGHIPTALVHGVHVTAGALPDPDAEPLAWHEMVGVSPVDRPSFILLADPFTLPTDRLLQGLDFAYPDSTKVGALASGARQEGGQVLLHRDRIVREGAVCVALTGDVDVAPVITGGCRAVGPPRRITDCDGHLLESLDGHPVLEALEETLEHAPARDRALARQALYLGFETNPFQAADDGPWLIRDLLGADPGTRGVYVGEVLRRGLRVRFHVCDRQTGSEDIERALARADAGVGTSVEGALLFACLHRGLRLYGTSDHDTRAFQAQFGNVPLGGFFSNGEIGPVGGSTHIHGLTSVFGLVRPRSDR